MTAAASGESSFSISTNRYFFFTLDSAVEDFDDLDGPFPPPPPPPPTRLCKSAQKDPISSSLPSKNGSNLSRSEVTDFASLAVAKTKSMTVGSDAPVRRRRESETNVRVSILFDVRNRSGYKSISSLAPPRAICMASFSPMVLYWKDGC
jgi:hypothetical protein